MHKGFGPGRSIFKIDRWPCAPIFHDMSKRTEGWFASFTYSCQANGHRRMQDLAPLPHPMQRSKSRLYDREKMPWGDRLRGSRLRDGRTIDQKLQRRARFELGNFAYIGRLRAFLSLHDFKLNFVTFLKAFIAIAGDRAIVNKHIWPAVASQKAIPFRVVKPLNSSLHAFHDPLHPPCTTSGGRTAWRNC